MTSNTPVVCISTSHTYSQSLSQFLSLNSSHPFPLTLLVFVSLPLSQSSRFILFLSLFLSLFSLYLHLLSRSLSPCFSFLSPCFSSLSPSYPFTSLSFYIPSFFSPTHSRYYIFHALFLLTPAISYDQSLHINSISSPPSSSPPTSLSLSGPLT